MLHKLLRGLDEHQIDKVSEVIEQHRGDKKDFVMYMVDVAVNGNHMTEHVARHAVSEMEHDDGGHGEHFSYEQVLRHAKDHTECIWDYYYVMNMMYSDYCTIFGADEMKYALLTKKFLEDVDAPKGKAKRYYYMNK